MNQESNTPDRREEILTAKILTVTDNPEDHFNFFKDEVLEAMSDYASLVCSEKDERIKNLEAENAELRKEIEHLNDTWPDDYT